MLLVLPFHADLGVPGGFDRRVSRREPVRHPDSPSVHEIEAGSFDANGLSRIGDDGGPYYVDDDHVSPHGARQMFTSLLRDWMRQLKPAE